jgi:DNA modification methylase
MEECVRRNLVRGNLDHQKFSALLASYLKDEKTFDWKKLTEAFACREQDLFRAVRANDDLRVFVEASKSPDSLPDVKEEEESSIVTKRGDLWELGPHRLYCGDATNPDDVAKLMGEDRAALFAIDPPYGVGYTGKNRPASEKGKAYAGGKDWRAVYDESKIANYLEFLKAAFQNAAKYLLPRTAWYVWHSHTNRSAVEDALAVVGVKVHQEIIWVKPSVVLNYSFFPYRHEPAVFAFKEGETPEMKPDQVSLYVEEHQKAAFGWKKGEKPPHRIDKNKFLTTVWEADFDGKSRLTKTVHPTQKPVILFEIPMLHHTEPGSICLDLFLGSGTSIIAAERTNRVVRAMEISPFFCDLAIRRWAEYSGNRPRCLNRSVEFPR